VGEIQATYPERRIDVQQSVISTATGMASGWPGCIKLVGNALQHGDDSDAVEVKVDGTRSEAVVVTVENSEPSPLTCYLSCSIPSGALSGRRAVPKDSAWVCTSCNKSSWRMVQRRSQIRRKQPDNLRRQNPALSTFFEARQHVCEAMYFGKRVVVHE